MHPVSYTVTHSSSAICGEYYLPEGFQPGMRCPAVILSHCFGGNGDTMVKYARPFLELGYAAFVFDFCGGGLCSRSSGTQQDLCFTTECADLSAVIDFALSQPFVSGGHLALAGESMGGVISAMVAAQNRYPVTQLVMISPAFCAPDDARRGAFGGASYALDAVPKIIVCPNGMRISRAFHEEAMAMDIWQAISGYQGTALLLHGMYDPVVPYHYAQEAVPHMAHMQLHLMEHMGHASMNAEQLDNALRVIRLYLLGKRSVLSIDVQVTGAERLRNDLSKPEPDEDLGGDFICAVYFTGTADSPAFHGVIAEGGVDRQTIRGGQMIRLCAEYTLVGTDAAGQCCQLHIINSGINGDYTPVIRTDSAALAWMSDAALTAVLEMRPQGPAITIWG